MRRFPRLGWGPAPLTPRGLMLMVTQTTAAPRSVACAAPGGSSVPTLASPSSVRVSSVFSSMSDKPLINNKKVSTSMSMMTIFPVYLSIFSPFTDRTLKIDKSKKIIDNLLWLFGISLFVLCLFWRNNNFLRVSWRRCDVLSRWNNNTQLET